MEKNPTSPVINEDSSEAEGGLDIGALFGKFIRNWKWFVLSFVLLIAYSILNLNFKRPQYEAVTTIEIKNDAGDTDPRLGVFSQLGIMAGSKDKVADEMEIIKSKSLIADVVRALNLNVKYFTDKNGVSSFFDNNLGMNTDFYAVERYDNPPLNITFLKRDSAVYNIETTFFVKIISANEFYFIDKDKIIEKKHSFGEKLTTNFGDIIITPNVEFKEENLLGQKVVVSISTLKDMVDYYSDNLQIQRKSEFSHILGITIVDGTRKKAVDFLNELVKKYNERAVHLKEKLIENTKEFVANRIRSLGVELSEAEEKTAQIKGQFGMSDAASSVGLNMQTSQIVEGEILDTETKVQNTNYLKEYINSSGANDLLNINLNGATDNTILDQSSQLNELVRKKQKLLENSTEKNPTVARLSTEIGNLRKSIKDGVANLELSYTQKLENLQNQQQTIRSRIYSAPGQEKIVKGAERQQSIKEELFTLLLRKREETSLTLGVHDPNARIIDYAESLPFPKSPKKKMALLIAGLIGLIIPAGIIYLKGSLDSKFHSREEVERSLPNVPIIGDIPKLESKGRYLIKKDDYSSIAEAFRILRTNIKFMLPKPKDNLGQVIFITSSIAHEGKSLVSANLSAALSFADKKTLLLGMDIRAPKIEAYLGVRSKIGVTNFVVNPELTPEEITVSSTEIANLDIISSGDLAPNPAELLMNERVAELFEYARANYDYVVVDTAAYSMVTDTLLLSGFADAFIYVVRTNYLDKKMFKYIRSLYNNKRLPNMSILINGIDANKGYGYGYGYGYGSEFDKSKKKWWKFN